ncbi:cutA1 divalent ion tolerance family protein [Anaplasma phagocytophilum str. CRT53-1]|uniref:CutA1 divalent ion tolerance family protein n=2 Tax=Anaplasma phagocytophilum TaxID=948 RepID=A0A0F3Q0V6_ANAPH|nr:divalent-cation tolerance protein CutA [Anaplasma phagocytophilum]EOA62120.1 periplasmic divalent cation tolerance protein CutA [Anaplasma phagocytophilum str. CRT38]KJV86113.1 cutA1 divalent ion tolerance family protein [Anaplasma phagocytophilum str. CRT53-1]
MSSALLLIYTTMPDHDSARNISELLLREKLISCSNMINGITSMYIWNGDINTSTECIVIMKTTAGLYEDIAKKIKELHPYNTPAIFSIPTHNCDPEFLKWVNSSTDRDIDC